ncbi:hypothetical protein DSO57_1022088 [Entomophthora muscae]|uniref:Uncharacterized protein n=2 Tax=Entomophthora muscae TaxID=34485 RepID=A0ACC2SFX4_9FUNG|nr:hypothetical protein DSO57_1022087 [Entomophthora muscae]KAJ9061293.1 hypothetical protein DSO57_1022088 [Entomophthora muscae]
MKLYLTLLLTSLIQAQETETKDQIIQRVCTKGSSSITIETENPNESNSADIFELRQDVEKCHKLSNANIFKSWKTSASSPPLDPSQSRIATETYVDTVSDSYGDPSFQSFNGYSFRINALNRTLVGQLLKADNKKTLIALDMDLEHWKEVGPEITKNHAKINHVVLRLSSGAAPMKMLREVFNSSPKVPISLMDKSATMIMKNLVKQIQEDHPNEKIFYSSNPKQEKGFSYFKNFGI